jgi:hypothetical protein
MASNEVPFTIHSINGTVWPRSVAEVQISFRPHEVGTHRAIAFCSITGLQNPLKLKLKVYFLTENRKISFLGESGRARGPI